LETQGAQEQANLSQLVAETRAINNRLEEAMKLEKSMLEAAARLAAM
jgi:hypothetical protein